MRNTCSKSIVFMAGVTCAVIGSLERTEAAERLLRAGAAASDITPPLGENVVGGFAPFPAEHIHDRLHARSLVLDNGVNRIAIVICDSLGIKRDVYDEARQRIEKETEIDGSQILFAATHTHSATPAASEKYRPQLIDGIVNAVKKAESALQPARIGWGSVDEPSEVFNRRWFVSNPELARNPFGGVDKVRMNPPRGNAALIKPAGPIDPEVSFLSVQTLDGSQIALLGNYSLHYVGGVKKGDVSSDYFGIFSNRIAELLSSGNENGSAIGMLSNGTSGDINNINFRQASPRRQPYEKMNEVAELIAKRVSEAHRELEFQHWLPLQIENRELTLQMRRPDDNMTKYQKMLREKPEDEPAFHRYELVYADRVQKLVEGPEEITVRLQAARIGGLGIAAIPFETFVEIGLQLKDESPFEDTFTIELANGWNGYLPTPEQHKLGGYETWMGTNRVQLDASEHITRDVLEMLGDLKKLPETLPQ